MSFTVDRRGRAFVLDQVNARVSVFESGRPSHTIALPTDTFQDVALHGDEGVAVLDRFGAESVAFVDATGKVASEVALAGEGVPSGGDVTALFQRDDGTWVEVGHASLVQIADADGKPAHPRRRVAGRFGPDGALLRLSKSGDRGAAVAVIDSGSRPRALARVEFPIPVLQLLELGSDAQGRIVVAAELFREGPAPSFELLEASEEVVVLSREGVELARWELPVSGPEESLRRVRLGGDSAIYHMGFDDSGVTLRRLEP